MDLLNLGRLADFFGQPLAVVEALVETDRGLITLGINPKAPIQDQIDRLCPSDEAGGMTIQDLLGGAC